MKLPQYLFFEVGDPVIWGQRDIKGIIVEVNGDRSESIRRHKTNEVCEYFGYKMSVNSSTYYVSDYCYVFRLDKESKRDEKLNQLLN